MSNFLSNFFGDSFWALSGQGDDVKEFEASKSLT
jgi:hypothetical protein